MPTAQRSKAEIHYEVTGHGPAIVFAHGAEFVLMPTCGHSTYFEDPSASSRSSATSSRGTRTSDTDTADCRPLSSVTSMP